MPKPKATETKPKYMKRCVKELVEVEGRSQKQAVYLCAMYWRQHKTGKKE